MAHTAASRMTSVEREHRLISRAEELMSIDNTPLFQSQSASRAIALVAIAKELRERRTAQHSEYL